MLLTNMAVGSGLLEKVQEQTGLAFHVGFQEQAGRTGKWESWQGADDEEKQQNRKTAAADAPYLGGYTILFQFQKGN